MENKLTHQEANVKIYWTKNYAQFNTIKGNRQIVDRNIKKLVQEIKKGNNLLKHYPILVNESMGVEDGQHRLEAAKATKQNIYYTINRNAHDLAGIAKLNDNNEKWKKEDYINCFIKSGIEDYRILRDFMYKYNLKTSISLPLLQFGNLTLSSGQRKEVQNSFKTGKFKVNHLKHACDFMDQLTLFNSFPSYRNSAFAQAITKVIKAEKIDIKLLASKFKKQVDSFKREATTKEYLAALEVIYNHGLHSRVTIF